VLDADWKPNPAREKDKEASPPPTPPHFPHILGLPLQQEIQDESETESSINALVFLYKDTSTNCTLINTHIQTLTGSVLGEFQAGNNFVQV